MNFKYGSLTGSRFLHLCYIGWEAGGLFSSWVTFDILIHSDSSLKPPHRPDCCSYTRPWENRRWRAASIQTPLVANSRCIHGRCEVAVPHACQMLVGPQACATSVRGKLCHTTGFQKLHVSHLAFQAAGGECSLSSCRIPMELYPVEEHRVNKPLCFPYCMPPRVKTAHSEAVQCKRLMPGTQLH